VAWWSMRRPAGEEPAEQPVSFELTEEHRAALPHRFEAAAEALAAGSDRVADACWVVGRDLAGVGTSLGESLEGLRTTTQLVRRRDPTFDELHALSVAWSEATLAYLHRLSCNDPLTGLSTHAHLRERISELYRDAAARSHALVVAEASSRDTTDAISHARTLTLLGDTARSVFTGEPVAQVGHSRLVLLAARDEQLAGRVSLLRRMTDGSADRVWIEGLPSTDDFAATLLDELARGA
jgi:hypothetical protein